MFITCCVPLNRWPISIRGGSDNFATTPDEEVGAFLLPPPLQNGGDKIVTTPPCEEAMEVGTKLSPDSPKKVGKKALQTHKTRPF